MSGDVKQGSKVELPLWLGEMLAVSYGTPMLPSHHLENVESLTLRR